MLEKGSWIVKGNVLSVKKILPTENIAALENPPYSPYLAPWNFYQFSKIYSEQNATPFFNSGREAREKRVAPAYSGKKQSTEFFSVVRGIIVLTQRRPTLNATSSNCTYSVTKVRTRLIFL